MAAMLETPSRIWRRIEEIENRDMPSLPSLNPLDDSQLPIDDNSDDQEDHLSDFSSPLHSTPAASSVHHTIASTIRPPSSASSTARFATSIASRSTKSLGFSSVSQRLSGVEKRSDSFDVSVIHPPNAGEDDDEMSIETRSREGQEEEHASKDSVPDVYLPPQDDVDASADEDDLSLTDALQSISRSSSPLYPSEPMQQGKTPKKSYDYSLSLKSEPKASPFDKFRNVALRRTAVPRTRTPSLSRTTPSPASSPSNSTPRSNRSLAFPQSDADSPIPGASIPLPRSNTASPAVMARDQSRTPSGDIQGITGNDMDVHSMDITDVQISPSESRSDEAASEVTRDATSSEADQETHSSEAPEPTFSSEGTEPASYATRQRSPKQTQQTSRNVSSSPPESAAFTLTSAFPRSRARFDVPSEDEEDMTAMPVTPAPNRMEDQPHEDSMTPHTRRRSFLLSVINSTTRPRLKFPTPHPRHMQIPVTPSITESTSDATSMTIRPTLQTAFAGVTPRPRVAANRPRASHPLAQAIVPSPGTSDSGSSLDSGDAAPQQTRMQWATPSNLSPYDGAADRASFVSTASSHDLTTHHRVNTSFDPAMGFGAGALGHGVGRFNAGKLNNYLHGLNRRLQEENEILLERLRKLEEEKKANTVASTPSVSSNQNLRRLSGGSNRRISVGGTALGDVEEDVGGENWVEEKASLEEMLDHVKEELAKCSQDKEDAEDALQKEKDERARDKERWKDRMAEVERGVSVIIKELENKAEAAVRKAKDVELESSRRIREVEGQAEALEEERALAIERADKAERALAGGKELGEELKSSNERITQLMGDLRKANAQIKALEEEVMRSDARIDDLEKDLRDDRNVINKMEEELNGKAIEVKAEKTRMTEVLAALRKANDDLRANQAYVTELEDGASSAIERIETLEEELASAKESIQALTDAEAQVQDDLDKLEDEAEKARQVARQMEDALEDAEKKMLGDEEAITELKNKVASLERELERQSPNSIAHRSSSERGPAQAEFEALEDELDDANKEIARLNAILNQSPARKAIEKAKDAKIEILEREKEELLERNKALRMTVNEFNTPNKLVNASGISPIHRHVLSLSFRAPRTPGGPLKELSWLNSTATDPSVSPLVAEISRLQRELDRANESIDDKLEKLEDAGLGVVELTRQLEDARYKISVLEEDIARLQRKEERRMHRLEHMRCKKCLLRVDLSSLNRLDESSSNISKDDLPTEPPTPPTRTTEALRANLTYLNAHLEALRKEWEEENGRLTGENATLRDATSKMSAQILTAKEEARKLAETERTGKKIRYDVEEELEKARGAIAELEEDLKSERAQLRGLTAEQNRVHREKTDILAQLRRTESDMDEVKDQLQKYKKENHDLEQELRENANAEQKARFLETRVSENTNTIDQLRQERELLVNDHKDLQRRFTEVSEQAAKLRDKYAASSTTHEKRRHKLDLYLSEIEDLRRALSDKEDALQQAEVERDRASTERSEVAKTVSALQADLKRVKKDAEAFGRDLKLLRSEKEKLEAKHKEELVQLERQKKQNQAQIRLLNEQLESQREKTNKARDQIKSHVCAADSQGLSDLKVQHKKECKGLIVQIRYLKAKCTREACLRSDLGYQKHYLLVLLSQFEKSERTIISSIARIGFPISLPAAKRPYKLRSAVWAVMFLSRAKRASDVWREHCSSKRAIEAALQDVRRRRAA